MKAAASQSVVALAMGTALVVATSAAQAQQTIVVPRDYQTIQAALHAAAPGATVEIRRGTYFEQLVISKNVTLRGAGVGQTIIRAPASLTPFAANVGTGQPATAIVRVTDGARLAASNLTVSGPIPCGVNTAGIRAVKGATLDLSDARVTAIEPADSTCPVATTNGSGVIIGLPSFIRIDGEPASGSTAHGRIIDVTIDHFLATAIGVGGPSGGPNSTATITGNEITGGTRFAVQGQSGVVASFASVARIIGNTIGALVCQDAVCGSDPITAVQSIGIGVGAPESPGTVVRDNTVSGTDVGIYLFGLTPGYVDTRGNRLRNNRYFGIVIQDGSTETRDNDITGGEVGVGVVADFVNTTATLRGDEIRRISEQPIKEISCCGFTAKAIWKD